MQNLEPWENVALGAIAGPAAMPCFQPFIYWKNTYAILGQPFTLNPRMIYRGLPVSMMLQGPVNGSQFWGTGAAKQVMGGKASEGSSTLTDAQITLAGFFGGCVSGFICAPQEILMVQQQKQGGTLTSVAKNIMGTHGPQRIMRGLPATSLREGFYTMGFLSLAGIFAQKVRDRPGFDINSPSDELKARMTGAICGGLTGAFVSHPIDFIKTNQQGDVGKARFHGFFHTGATLYKELGITAFYRGLPWRSCGIVVGAFTINAWKDILGPVFFPHRFEQPK